jgi:hypothetical protein
MFQFRLTAQERWLSANPRLFRHGQDQRPTRLRFRRRGSGVRRCRDFDPQRRQNRANCWRLIPGLTTMERLRTTLASLCLSFALLEGLLESASKKEPSYADFLLEVTSAEADARRQRYLSFLQSCVSNFYNFAEGCCLAACVFAGADV